MATGPLRVLLGLLLLSASAGVAGCKGTPREILRGRPRCEENAQCVPDPTVGEPRKCVLASGARAPDQKTPFDLGFTCACLDGGCVLAAGSAAERDALEAARVFTAARYPSCTGDAIRNLELRRWDGTGHAFVWMNCHCGDDCGYSCEFEVALDDAKGTWAVVPQEYLCGVK